MTPSTYGRSAPYRSATDAASSTMNGEPKETPTIRRSEHSGTGSSASSTAAYDTGLSTTKTPLGATVNTTLKRSPLDKNHPWGVLLDDAAYSL